MSASTENWAGRVALMIAHCAGMVDLVALPVWVGALIEKYGFDSRTPAAWRRCFSSAPCCRACSSRREFGKLNAARGGDDRLRAGGDCVLRRRLA